MRNLHVLLVRLWGLFGKDKREQELTVELESHLQMNIEDHLRSGMTPGEARRRALRSPDPERMPGPILVC